MARWARTLLPASSVSFQLMDRLAAPSARLPPAEPGPALVAMLDRDTAAEDPFSALAETRTDPV